METECSMFELRVSGSQTEKGTSNHEIHKARSFLCNSISHWWDKRSKWTGTYSFSKYSLCVIHSAKKTTVIFVYWRCALCFFWPHSVWFRCVWQSQCPIAIRVNRAFTQICPITLPYPPNLLTSVRLQGWALEPIPANQNPSQGMHRWSLERDVLSFLLIHIIKDVIPEHQAAPTWQKYIWIVGK